MPAACRATLMTQITAAASLATPPEENLASVTTEIVVILQETETETEELWTIE